MSKDGTVYCGHPLEGQCEHLQTHWDGTGYCVHYNIMLLWSDETVSPGFWIRCPACIRDERGTR